MELQIKKVDNGFLVDDFQIERNPFHRKKVFEFGSEAEMIRFLASRIQECFVEVEHEDDVSS